MALIREILYQYVDWIWDVSSILFIILKRKWGLKFLELPLDNNLHSRNNININCVKSYKYVCLFCEQIKSLSNKRSKFVRSPDRNIYLWFQHKFYSIDSFRTEGILLLSREYLSSALINCFILYLKIRFQVFISASFYVIT